MMTSKKNILLIASNAFKEPELFAGNNTFIKSLNHLGYVTDLFVFTNIDELIKKLKSTDPHLVFNLFQNTADDISKQMSITGILELMNIPYIGNTPFVLGLSITKNFVKRLLENKRIQSIPYQIYRETPSTTYLKFPVIMRDANRDWPISRLEQNKITDFQSLQTEVDNYFDNHKQPILVESFIPGKILLVGVFGNDNSQVLPVCEAISENSKYKYLCPAEIDSDVAYHVRNLAIQVFKYLMGKDYAIISFLLDEKNKIYVADYNPNPSLFSGSIFQLSFKVSKFDFNEFLKNIIQGAIK